MARRKNQNSPIGSPLSGNVSDSSSNNKEQDRFLPIANVSRIMKKSLPAKAKISKEAKETVQECASEFINFITGEASEKCQKEKRKTINGDDLLWAMTTLGFENYVNPLKLYLNKYRENEGDKSSTSTLKEEDHHQLPLSHVNNSQQIFQGTTDNHHSIPTIWPNSPATNTGYYSFDANLTSKTYENASRALGYGENMMMMTGAYNIAKIHELEENANRVLTTNTLHHGVG